MRIVVLACVFGAALWSSPASAHKCSTVPVRIHGTVIDGLTALPVSSGSVLAFVDDYELPGCDLARGASPLTTGGEFEVVACWTYRSRFAFGGWGTCGGRPKTLTILVEGLDLPAWKATVELKKDHIHAETEGFSVELPPIKIFGDAPRKLSARPYNYGVNPSSVALTAVAGACAGLAPAAGYAGR